MYSLFYKFNFFNDKAYVNKIDLLRHLRSSDMMPIKDAFYVVCNVLNKTLYFQYGVTVYKYYRASQNIWFHLKFE